MCVCVYRDTPSVCQDGQDKIHRLGIINNGNGLSHGSGGPRSRCLQGWCLLRCLSSTHIQLPSCCLCLMVVPVVLLP